LYPEIVASNIDSTLNLLGGDANRWRVHIKTAKLGYTLRIADRAWHPQFSNARLLWNFSWLAAAERKDVLFAHPAWEPIARRVARNRRAVPASAISVLA